jgi:hypothetical protein
LGALGRVAAAAFLLAGSFSALRLGGGRPLSAAGRPVASAVRSGELLAAYGRDVGQAYTFRGRPSWVLMAVRASGLAGIYVCELQLGNGARIMAGVMVVTNGAGAWARSVRIDVSRLRRALLETSTGEVVATATLA